MRAVAEADVEPLSADGSSEPGQQCRLPHAVDVSSLVA